MSLNKKVVKIKKVMMRPKGKDGYGKKKVNRFLFPGLSREETETETEMAHGISVHKLWKK